MPAGAIYVGRPTKWGNPYHVSKTFDNRQICVDYFRELMESHLGETSVSREWCLSKLELLRGHDLACWCPLDQPCHADVLLELANQ